MEICEEPFTKVDLIQVKNKGAYLEKKVIIISEYFILTRKTYMSGQRTIKKLNHSKNTTKLIVHHTVQNIMKHDCRPNI
jgi:hypothetical protein